MKSLAATAALAALVTAPAFADCSLSADAQEGKTVSALCKTCHIFEAGKPARPTGPNLHDIYGSPAGSNPHFTYSDGMLGAKSKGITWTDDNLLAYIGDPKAFLDKVNGTELTHWMLFQLKDEQERKDVVAFLKAIKGNADCN